MTITGRAPVSFPQLGNPPLLVIGFYQMISLPFGESPRLTRLSWPYPLKLHEITNPRIPWRLTSAMRFYTALEMIRLCPQLEEFTTRLPKNSDYHQTTTVKNHHLRRLDITCGADCSPFFDSLVLPELGEFSLNSPTSFVNGGRAFLDLLTRSNCKLYKRFLIVRSSPLWSAQNTRVSEISGHQASITVPRSPTTSLFASRISHPPRTSRIAAQTDTSDASLVPRRFKGNGAFTTLSTGWTQNRTITAFAGF